MAPLLFFFPAPLPTHPLSLLLPAFILPIPPPHPRLMKRFYGLKKPRAERTGRPWLAWGRWGRGLVDYVYRGSRGCSPTCGFNDQHAGQKHFAQCLFSCLALTNKVYGSSMENVCCFSLFFFFNCFCLKFDRLNYCKHSLFLCLRYWMENSIVCCWTVLEIFGQMCVNLAVMAFKANKQTKKSCENGLGALSLVTWRVSSFFKYSLC